MTNEENGYPGRSARFITALLYSSRTTTSFSGSAGTAVVSMNNAYLFTDSRYWSQAERELDRNWILQRVGGSDGTENWKDYIVVSSFAIV
jgi:hypothetical protein